MDSNLITPNPNNEQISKPIENEFNSNSNTPTPVQNPQDCTPSGFNGLIFQPQAYPDNPNADNPNEPQQNKKFSCSPRAIKLAFLIMSIMQFLFFVVEIAILIVNGWMGIILIHIDEVGILVVSTLFFFSYLDKCEINKLLRTILTGVICFVGFIIRGMANMFIDTTNIAFILIFFALMIIRTFILFFSILISNFKSMSLNHAS